MLALSPENIEVQMMFRKIAAVAALCLPTFAQAEIIELTCRHPVMTDTSTLTFDTVTNQVGFGTWPVSEVSVWQDDFIYWTNINNPMNEGDYVANAYMFNRETGELLMQGVSKPYWTALQSGNQASSFFYQCSRPF